MLRSEGEAGIVEAGGNEKASFIDDGDGDRDGGSGNMYGSISVGTSTRNGRGSLESGEGEVGSGGKASTGGGETGSAFVGSSAS